MVNLDASMRAFGILLLLAVAATAGFFYWQRSRGASVPVILHAVSKGAVEAIVANTRAGTVEAARRAKLAPQIGGQVHRLEVREGAQVVAGQVLIELWNGDLSAQVHLAESEEVRAHALVEQAARLAEVAESESKRQQELGAIASPERVERLLAEARARKAELEAARAAVTVASRRVLAAKASLERTVLTAPFAGVVAEVNCELGECVTPSPPGLPTLPAIDLIDTTNLRVKAPIDEIDATAVAIGQEARIALDAYPGRRFAGKVVRIAPYVLDREKEARTVDVEVLFADAAEAKAVLPGASADVEIVLERAAATLRVPTEALLEGKRVLIWTALDRPLEERKVETGLGNFVWTEIKRGLAEDERVVVSIDRPGVKAGAFAVPEGGR